MLEPKDPAIKLFGKTIPLMSNDEMSAVSTDSDAPTAANEEKLHKDRPSATTVQEQDNKSKKAGGQEQDEEEKDQSGGKPAKTEGEDGNGLPPASVKEVTDHDTSLVINENPKTPSVDKETATPKASKTEEEQSETSIPQEKTLKKPDKILPCPRCNSMDTKFCYYNNYNVNQPRHFCKNCQRYWTAGGTMRNVPVGAGRRKNKNSASHYRHITTSEALQTSRADAPDGVHHPTPNGTVLTFGSDAPLCESMASVLNLAEKTMRNCTTRNGFHRPEEQRIPVSSGAENGDDRSSGSSITASNHTEEGNRVSLQEPVMRNCHGFPPQIPYFPGTPWPYPWNSAQWSSAVPPPAFCPSSFPISFYPAATYWGCTVPGTWNIPWISQPPSSPSPGGPGSSPNSPLGKHSRDGKVLKPSNSEKEDQLKQNSSEKCLWIPKTLRIDDPSEAARSSIWATLGIKNDKPDSKTAGGLLKVFQPKGDDEKNHMAETSQVLQANPAALSRSLNFQERS
ncbi:PREDICTED: cyclic dof factor 2-like [Nelumbo nucifera]|uniref:Dof-type domain-containing protein n=2 Tax=Nelumbo nucifera TaxID=4432 RepID=A0A822YGL8_NELNU|nr:PREDICTED: cyclic dof factor 2-like [Nelumbo nucifera]DAD31283.1 TPA_asm: hypothetical protein HUJ06_010134 [Nelumbo nucifera]